MVATVMGVIGGTVVVAFLLALFGKRNGGQDSPPNQADDDHQSSDGAG